MRVKFLLLVLLLITCSLGVDECTPPLHPPASFVDQITLQGVTIKLELIDDQLVSVQGIDQNDNVAATLTVGEALPGNKWGRLFFNDTLKLSTVIANKKFVEDGLAVGRPILIQVVFSRLLPLVKKPEDVLALYVLGSGKYQILQ